MEARSNHREFFTEQAVRVIELLGRQLGLYLFLADRLRDLRSTQKALSEALEAERETFENLVHQLKTPIYLSVRRSTRIAANARNRSFDLLSEAVALRADCRRSERVVGNVALFADVARGEKIGVHRSPLTLKYLIPYLHELVNEHALLVNPEHRITFVVDEPSFSLLDQVLVQVDLHLLDQMLGNLFDNAVKYSFRQSQIVIKGGPTRHQQFFYIGVTNRGVPIAPEEARRLAERGSRSDRALNKEGSGLGLYLVRQMLDAHGGTLEIQPTNSNGVTEVRLLLPCTGRVPEV
jgi:signal transduction histidine kinase